MAKHYFLSCPLLMFVLVGSLQAQRAPSDSARLQGAWLMISGSANGTEMPPEYLSQMKRVFVGNEVTVTMADHTFFKATIVLDPKQSPRTIDYRMIAGPTAGQVQLGIYEIVGDTVRFSFAAVTAGRPADFSTASGDGRTRSTWVRKQ
jgi:uncharacterized protein (TIGR03067 family)